MKAMKLRLLLMGGIISVLAIGETIARGFDYAFMGLLGVGLVLLAIGLIWK